jgi:(heptosyl)LPS beta-1,4-glucosyltransferase
MVSVTAVVIAQNEEGHIVACLESLAWADERLVVDSGSTDATVTLAQQAGARVEHRDWVSFPDQRNAAMQLATGDWVFFVDADERVTPELAAEIRMVVQEATVAAPVMYWSPRHNIIFGKVILHTGWYPDFQPRLFRRGFASFDSARVVHELPVFKGGAGHLKSPLTHYNYESISDFLTKQMRYADLDVQRLREEGVRPRFWAPVLQPLRQFHWRFFGLRGYLDGGHGFVLSLLMAYYDFQVYWRLRRALHSQAGAAGGWPAML